MNDCLKMDGYSKDARRVILKQHSEGSVRQYQHAWSLFLRFMRRNKVPHTSVKLSTVLNFLAEEAGKKKRAYRTVAAYRCALKQPLLLHYGLDIDCPTSVAFMKGLFHIRPPCRGAPMPMWELTDLPQYLRSDV